MSEAVTQHPISIALLRRSLKRDDGTVCQTDRVSNQRWRADPIQQSVSMGSVDQTGSYRFRLRTMKNPAESLAINSH